jgi:hypothetical protein
MSKEFNQKIVEQWERLKVLVAAAEDDVLKNARGNASAGVRARKGLRALKKEASDLVKMTVEEGKRRKETQG